jgi:superfamily II DNA or RNA helicase
LFLVAGGRNESELEQKIGRIQRSCSGKKDAIVFDFIDERIGVFQGQYWARRKVYKRLGMLGNGEKRQVG